ncbi:hypothetical protein [Paenibacillus sp. sgz5001063]|uniref:hypothetical protein n=1 Tax=Paenibacillus sp. sgz5001063 TaxID=3242474 RepID=UPI0036D24536
MLEPRPILHFVKSIVSCTHISVRASDSALQQPRCSSRAAIYSKQPGGHSRLFAILPPKERRGIFVSVEPLAERAELFWRNGVFAFVPGFAPRNQIQ